MRYTSIYPHLPKRRYFQIGDRGSQVNLLQRLLNWANTGARMTPLETDGVYGRLTEKAVKFFEQVHGLAVDGQFGKRCLAAARDIDLNSGLKALNWAVSIANDNSFAYGVGERAHHAGCFFCGTNITGVKHAKKGSRWEKTYCCNPFVFAAYAHGARIPAVERACRNGACGGMTPGAWTRYGVFKTVGKAAELRSRDLRPGDVIICSNHVYLQGVGDRLAEASGEGWGSDTIAYKKGAKRRFRAYRRDKTAYVIRSRG